jgi:hypothetical protein
MAVPCFSRIVFPLAITFPSSGRTGVWPKSATSSLMGCQRAQSSMSEIRMAEWKNTAISTAASDISRMVRTRKRWSIVWTLQLTGGSDHAMKALERILCPFMPLAKMELPSVSRVITKKQKCSWKMEPRGPRSNIGAEQDWSRTSTATTDAKGQLLHDVRDFENSSHRETHRYDQFGREIEKAEWNKDGTIINRRTYVYSDDPQDNWIRRTELFWSCALSEPVEGEVTARIIDYY